MTYSSKRPGGKAIFVIACAIDAATTITVLLCLTRPHSPWLWGFVALGAGIFVALIRWLGPVPTYIHSFFALICLGIVVAWYFWVDHLVVTIADGLGLLAGVILLIMVARRRK